MESKIIINISEDDGYATIQVSQSEDLSLGDTIMYLELALEAAKRPRLEAVK